MTKKLMLICTPLLILSLLLSMPALAASHMASKADSSFINPDTTGLYGGLIHWIEVVDLGENQSRVFISTQSANSMFYADVDHDEDDPFEDVKFRIVPDLDADAGFGEIRTFAVDEASKWLYFTWWPEGGSEQGDHEEGIYRCNITEGSLTHVDLVEDDGPDSWLGYVDSLMIHDSRLFFVEEHWNDDDSEYYFHFGAIDATTGEYTEDAASPVLLSSEDMGYSRRIAHNPDNDYLYILDGGDHWGDRDIDGMIYKTSDTYDNLSGSTSFGKIVPPQGSSQSPRQYESLGISPNGHLFLAGSQQTDRGYHESIVIYSENDGGTWETGSRDEYCWAWQGPNFAFLENGSDAYDIISGTLISEDDGETWSMLPRNGNVWPHPGAIAFDPNDENAFYVQCDRGIAVTTDAGYSFEKAWARSEDTWIEDIEVIDLGNDKSRIFIRERECHDPGQYEYDQYDTIYYADIDYTGDSPSYGDFQRVAGMDEGTQWQIWSQFTIDSASGYLFFEGNENVGETSNSGLYRTDGSTAPALVDLGSSWYASRPLIYDGIAFFVNSSGGYWESGYWVDGYWEEEQEWVPGYDDAEGNWIDGYWTDGVWVDGYWVDGTQSDPASNLCYGTINEYGTFTQGCEVQITETDYLCADRIIINSYDNCLYILSNDWSTGSKIYKSTDTYDELSESTEFDEIETPSSGSTDSSGMGMPGATSDTYQWNAFGIGPDGRIFLGGWSSSGMGGNAIAYSEAGGENWETISLENEWCGIGDEFAFRETATGYDAFCGTMVSSNKGANWGSLPRKDDTKAHPSSSCIQIDPNDPQVIYIPTSKGIGVSADGGYHFIEINEGVEAVQIKDLALDPDNGIGWSVAKSGVRRVSDVQTNPQWSAPMDPDGQGGQYRTVDMDVSDETGNTAYVGMDWGDTVYKTTDGGDNWESLRRPQPQYNPDPEDTTSLDYTWCWPNWNGSVSDIKVDPYDDNHRVFVGFDAGRWRDQEEATFGQLWVIDEDTVQSWDETSAWMPDPWNNTGWSQIIIRADADNDSIIQCEDGNGNNWAHMKGDVNVHDILIIQENGETVIYIAASYSDEETAPIDDEEEVNNSLYDSQGYPMIYKLYRMVEDTDSGWTVTEELFREYASITTLSIDSNGTLYACGKDYDEDTYKGYLNDYKKEYQVRAKAREKAEARQDFYEELYDEFYDVVSEQFLIESAETDDESDYGEDYRDEEYYEYMEQCLEEFVELYFTDYDGTDFDTYFATCFDEYFEQECAIEFENRFDEDFDKHFNDDWDWNKPQQGLRTVYQRSLGGEWTTLPIKGLNDAHVMDWHWDFNQEVMTVGEDPADSSSEVPYVAYNRFIYYLPEGSAGWVLGCEYPAGTEIYTMVGLVSSASTASVEPAADDGAYVYVGTGTGLYGQMMTASEYEEFVSSAGGYSLSKIIAGVVAVVVMGGVGRFLIMRRRVMRQRRAGLYA